MTKNIFFMVCIGISGTLFAGKINEVHPEYPKEINSAIKIFNNFSKADKVKTIADEIALEKLVRDSGLRERWNRDTSLRDTDMKSFYDATQASELIPCVKWYCLNQLNLTLQGIIGMYECDKACMERIEKNVDVIRQWFEPNEEQFFDTYMFYYENELPSKD